MFRDWPAAPHPTPVTARPPAGRAGRGGFVDGKGSTAPKPSPRGEGGPAKPGRMRGRPGTQQSRRSPAYRRQAVGHWFSTRKGFGVIAPSSVCFADSFPPRGSRWTWQVNRPYPICTKRLPQPAQLGGGPLPASDAGPQARQKKREDPRRVPPTRKGGSREEEPLPPWCSFLRLSSKESRAPARGRAGNHLAGSNLRRSKRDHLPKPMPPPAAPPPPLPGEQKGQRKAGRREEELPPGQAQGGQQGSACQAVAQGQQDLHPR